MNEILAKNIEYIKKYDSELAEKIISISELPTNIQMGYTELQEANLYIDNLPFHSQTGAQTEAEQIVKSIKNNYANSIHVVLGMGFGYLFYETAHYSKGSVILFEPDINILRVALEMVDFSDIFQNKRVFITEDVNKLDKYYGDAFSGGTKAEFLSIPYYRRYKAEIFNKTLEKLGVLQTLCEQNIKQRAVQCFKYSVGVIKNIPLFQKCKSIIEFKDKFKNLPAVVIASGPSLANNIDILKKYRNRAIFFGVSTSLNVLNSNEIYPDFVSILEQRDTRIVLENCKLDKSILIAEPYINDRVLKLDFADKIITASNENTANNIYLKTCGIEPYEFETKGTVAYNALYSAILMGCNPIIVVGQDLAYTDGNCYSSNSVLRDYKCRKKHDGTWEIYIENRERLKKNLYGEHASMPETDKYIDERAEEINKELTSVIASDGTEVATTTTFKIFIEYYKMFAKRYSNKIQLYNACPNGANIDFEYKSLSEFFENLPEINPEIKAENSSELSIEKVMQIIIAEREKLIQIYNKMDEASSSWDKLIELCQEGQLTKDVLLLIKFVIQKYFEIEKEAVSLSFVYPEVTYTSRVLVPQAINSVNGELTFRNTHFLANAFGNFYKVDKNRIKQTIIELERVMGRIKDENCCTAS